MKQFNQVVKALIGLGLMGLLIFALILSIQGLNPVTSSISGQDKRSTSEPYPAPIPTRPPSKVLTPTNPPKWTSVPTLTSMPTLRPTPFPLKSSQFTAIWRENDPTRSIATIWGADPADIGNRKAWVILKNQQIEEAVLSPDGKKIAFTCPSSSRSYSLFVYNIETDRLTQLDHQPNPNPNTGPILWDRESRFFSFLSILRSNVVRTTDEDDYPESVTVNVYDLTEERQRKIIELPGDYRFTPLGWTANGHLLITHPEKGSYDYTLAEINPAAPEIQSFFKFSVSELDTPFRLSPDGTRFFYGDSQGFHWVTLGGQKVDISPKFTGSYIGNYDVLWPAQNDRLLVGQRENTPNSVYHITVLDLQNRSEQEIAQRPLKDFSGWGLLSISPDNQWLAAYQYQKGVYLISLPDFYLVRIDVLEYGASFVGWTTSITNGK
jgi:hypothetical protein